MKFAEKKIHENARSRNHKNFFWKLCNAFISIFSNPKIIHDKIILHFVSPSNILLVLLQRDFVESLNARKINFVIFIFLRIWGSHWNFHFFEAFSDGIQFVHGDLILIHINEAIDISNFAWNTIRNAFVTIWKKFIKNVRFGIL